MALLFQTEIDKAKAAQAKNPNIRPIIRCPECHNWIDGKPNQKVPCPHCCKYVEVKK